MADREAEQYVNPYNIEDYRDVLNLAWIWRSYWMQSKMQMMRGFHWYHKEIPIVTPKQVEAHVPSTATTLVNDAADHLSGNEPTYEVKSTRETQRADVEKQRVQTSLNSLWKLLGKEYGHPIHRIMAIDGGWSGMMAAKVTVKEGWDIKNPRPEDLRWQPQDPRFVYPDPGSLGRKAVIVWMQQNVGLIRQQWPDWDGHWFPNAGWEGQFYASPYIDVALTNPAGGFIGERKKLPQPLNDNATVTWIEYWDSKYKCFIANGVPVFRAEFGQDLVEHGMGTIPFCIRSAGYGTITGETQHRFKAMLANVFSELDTEAALLTQLKWIVQETAWPVFLAPKDTEGEFDTEPGSLNFIENAESIKAIRTLREDAVEPKAIIELLDYIKEEIEKATYPRVLKGESPSGVRAGYPIAILSSQAKLKFASPTDALKGILLDLGLKTLQIVRNRFKIPMEVIDGYKLQPDDYDTYLGRIEVSLEPQLPQDLATKLPIFEMLYGSAHFPAAEVIRGLGHENPEQLMELRMAEDLQFDPRTQQMMVEHLVQNLLPETAAAVMEVAEPNKDLLKMQEAIQQMQGQIQLMQMQQQFKELQAQAQLAQQAQASGQPIPGVSTQGPPQFGGGGAPQPGGPPRPGMTPPPIVAGGPGGSNTFGQAPGAPGATRGGPMINPLTQLSQEARGMSAVRTMQGFGAENAAFGEPTSGSIT